MSSLNTKQPVVVFCIEELSVGGAEQMLLSMANEFVGRNWQVHVVCLTKAGELASRLDEPVQLHVLNKRPGIDLRLPWRLSRLISQINPDVINAHLWVANAWTRLSLYFTNTPIITTEHSRDSWKPLYYRWLDKLFSRRTFKLVAVSEDTAAFYRHDIGLGDSLVTIINNGIDTKRYAAGCPEPLRGNWLANPGDANDPREGVLIGTVGRLVAAKNHRRLIDAIDLLNRDRTLSHFNIRLKIVGEGPERSSIQRYIYELGLDTQVTLAGARHDIPDVLSAFDIFVLSSDREGHPLTALEAQASGTPVVLTDAGGSGEAIAQKAEQVGGVLVEQSAQALCDAIREMIVDSGLRLSRGNFARQYAQDHFDRQVMMDRYEALFDIAAHSERRG